MPSQYHMDTEEFGLERLRRVVDGGGLLPSERILAEEVPERFVILEARGMRSLKDLTTALSTKKKLERLAQETGLPRDYLTVLRRRAGLYTPKPVPLSKMPGIQPELVERLAAAGVKNSKQLFDLALTADDRQELARRAGVPASALLELVKLSDLVRAPYVGPVFARLFFEAGTDTLAKLVASDPEELCQRLRATNDELELTRAGLPSPEDMATGLEFYRMIPQVVEW